MSYLKTKDGVELYYKDWLGQGSTGMPVVLIHGWPATADMWESQAVALAEQGFRVVSYDRRGFGRSSQPWNGYNYDTFSDDLAAVLDTLDLRGAALVGFSMGGGEVVRYIARHGESRIAKAVLVASVVPFMLKTDDHQEGIDKSVFDGFIEQIRADRPAFMEGFWKGFYGRSMLHHGVSDAVLDWSQWMSNQASPRATTECVTAFGETDFRADCAKVTVPTLVIHGSSDATVPIDLTGRAAAKLIAGAKFLEYEGEPHGLFATAADKLNTDLLAFLRSE